MTPDEEVLKTPRDQQQPRLNPDQPKVLAEAAQHAFEVAEGAQHAFDAAELRAVEANLAVERATGEEERANRKDAARLAKAEVAVAKVKRKSANAGWKTAQKMVEAAAEKLTEEDEAASQVQVGLQFRMTDTGNGKLFVSQHSELVRYMHGKKQWYVWNNKLWKPDTDKAVHRLAETVAEYWRRFLGEARSALEPMTIRGWADHTESVPAIRAMLEQASIQHEVIVEWGELNATPWLLNVANGTIDLRTGELRPPSQTDLISKMIDLDYVPDAHSEEWERLLLEKLPDVEVRNYVQELVGYSASGETTEDVTPFLYGKGGGGKTTFIGAIMSALGGSLEQTGYATTTDFSMFLNEPFESKGYRDLWRCTESRVVVASEVPPGKRFETARFNAMVSCEPMLVRKMRGDPYTTNPRWKIWLVGNDRPEAPASASGFWRRIRIIPFDQILTEDKQDKGLRNRLKDNVENRQAVLAWIVRGAVRYYQRGRLGQAPENVLAATRSYRTEMDVLRRFVHDQFVSDPKGFVPNDVLAEIVNEEQARYKGLSRTDLPEIRKLLIEEFGARDARPRAGEDRVRGLAGVAIAWDEEPDFVLDDRDTEPAEFELPVPGFKDVSAEEMAKALHVLHRRNRALASRRRR
jgi:putative DNA primase/helicase